MYPAVQDTPQDLRVLVIGDDVEKARSIQRCVQTAPFIIGTVDATTDLAATLQKIEPQVVIIITDDCSLVAAIHSLLSEQSILIAINDTPSDTFFEYADGVIPTQFAPHLTKIILAHTTKVDIRRMQAHQQQVLERENQHIKQDLADTHRSSAEIDLLKHAIVHSVSHELRTPMLQVKSAVALLREELTANKTIVDLALEATARLEGRIRNITMLNELMIERCDTNTFTATRVTQLIQGAVRNLGKSWEHKRETTRIQTPHVDNDLTIVCDKQRLTVAVQLLLDNALKFSESVVNIDSFQADGNVRIIVRDQGIGIAADQLERVSEPFYQIDGTTTRQFGGMGVGLAIVKMILEQHGSGIQIESLYGKGSSFWFDLPAYKST